MGEEVSQHLWETIDLLIKQSGLTRPEVALRSGLDKSTLNRSKINSFSKRAGCTMRPRPMSFTTVEKICSGLNISLVDFAKIYETISHDDKSRMDD